MKNSPGVDVLRRQDFAYKTGDGICTLALVRECSGQLAVHWTTHHLGARRRFARPTLRAAEARYVALQHELEHYGLRPTRL